MTVGVHVAGDQGAGTELDDVRKTGVKASGIVVDEDGDCRNVPIGHSDIEVSIAVGIHGDNIRHLMSDEDVPAGTVEMTCSVVGENGHGLSEAVGDNEIGRTAKNGSRLDGDQPVPPREARGETRIRHAEFIGKRTDAIVQQHQHSTATRHGDVNVAVEVEICNDEIGRPKTRINRWSGIQIEGPTTPLKTNLDPCEGARGVAENGQSTGMGPAQQRQVDHFDDLLLARPRCYDEGIFRRWTSVHPELIPFELEASNI